MGNSDDDSDFAEYGTALEPIEEDDVAKKRPIHVSEQIVTDEKGRRRFHGAFTGGFSAGYFNTVGSKEGWAPSTFKSSRSDRGAFKSQNVLDFMDDEDKGAFGIAPQVLRPTDDFSDKNESRGRKRPRREDTDGPIPGAPVLEQIIQPVRETVGIRILVKMGWRPGKGVGPKIDRRDRPKRAKKSEIKKSVNEPTKIDEEPETTNRKLYGCSLPAEFMQHKDDSYSETDDELEEAKAALAPDDVNSLLCNPKENTFGLGYKGLDRNALTANTVHTDLFGSKLKFRVENKNLSITGQAFGVGAFEENDDDIYAREDMSQYDFALETPEERKQKKAKEEREKRKNKNKENCVDGFRIASITSTRRKFYAPPHLPPNFQPYHSTKKSRFETSKLGDEKQDALSKGLARHSLTISERQVLIEDDVSKIPPVSTTNNSTASQINLPSHEVPTLERQAKDSSTPTIKATVEPDNDIKYRIERLKKFTQVLQAYSSKTPDESPSAAFKPFMKNPEKQERYEKYLTLRDAGFSECLKDLQPPDMTEWERDREKMEFERASKLYKPMNSILASRFVSAKSHDISHLEPEKEHVKEKDAKDDPKVAARMKLFGKLTHRMMEWHPDKLVCKRFNIPHPYPDSKFVGLKEDPSIWGSKASNVLNKDAQEAASKLVEIPKKKGLFDNLDFSKPPPGLLPQELGETSSYKTGSMESSGEADVNTAAASTTTPVLEFQQAITTAGSTSNNAEEKTEAERPPLDLFKEIFADSSDSENEEVEAELPTTRSEKSPGKAYDSHRQISQHMLREKTTRDDKALDKMVSSNDDKNSLPPENESVNQQKETRKRGVFDRIDLDMLQNNAHRLLGTGNNKSSRHANNSDGSSDEGMDDVYGPAPPKNVVSGSTSRRHQSGSSLSTTAVSSIPASSSSIQARHKSTFDDPKKEVSTEEVIWVEKSALSDGSSSSKNHAKGRKHSTKKSKRKSNKKEKRKSHKSKQRSKHKKKGRKHKSKSKHSSDESRSSDDDGSSDSNGSSDSSITINDSLDNRALLAKLKQITRSN